MISLEKPNSNDVVVFSARDKITKHDYQLALSQLDEYLHDRNKLRFYIEIENVTGLEPSVIWEDLKFGINHKDRIGRMAVVGDERWEELAVKASDFLYKSDIQFFYPNKKDAAWEWANK